jgi:hypothetical protein
VRTFSTTSAQVEVIAGIADRSRAALTLLNACTGRASGFAHSCTGAAWFWSFSSPSCQIEAIATCALPRVAICLLRSFSATFARALSAVARLIWSLAGGGALDRVALGTSSRGNLGRLNTSRCETCGQAEHLNVWRSNATSDAGSHRWSTCIRRISVPQAKQSMVLCPKILQACSAARFRSVKLLSDPFLLDDPHSGREMMRSGREPQVAFVLADAAARRRERFSRPRLYWLTEGDAATGGWAWASVRRPRRRAAAAKQRIDEAHSLSNAAMTSASLSGVR